MLARRHDPGAGGERAAPIFFLPLPHACAHDLIHQPGENARVRPVATQPLAYLGGQLLPGEGFQELYVSIGVGEPEHLSRYRARQQGQRAEGAFFSGEATCYYGEYALSFAVSTGQGSLGPLKGIPAHAQKVC